MRVLHLFANHKFTGPADPALILAEAEAQQGVEVTFACSSLPEEQENPLKNQIEDRQLDTIGGLRLPKHFDGLSAFADSRRLRRALAAGRYDLVHCHLANDHLTATIAGRGLEIPVVRSLYDLEPPVGMRARYALARSAAIFPPSDKASLRLEKSRGISKPRLTTISPVLDLDRFDRDPDDEIRHSWGCSSRSDVVIGVVARMQRHRLFDLLLEGFCIAAEECPQLRLVVLGRGTHRQEVAIGPAQRSKFSRRIRFPGYIDPRDYPRHLASFDLLVYLVPGSDGTCRAARESLASGVPVISSARGLLPELIPQGPGGRILEGEEASILAQHLVEFASDTASRPHHRHAAREFARDRFDPLRGAQRAIEAYEASLRR